MPGADNDLETRSFVMGRPNQMPRLGTFDFYLMEVGRGERDIYSLSAPHKIA